MTAHSHAHAHKKVLLPVLLTCAGYLCYCICDTIIKYLLQERHIHYSQMMLVNGGVIICFMLIYGVWKEGKKTFRTSKPGLMFIRAICSLITTFCNFFAFPHIQLTTFYTLVFTSPFWVALISALFFKDRLDARRMAVILFGFCVVLAIFHPGSSLFNVWALLTLLAAFVYSWQLVIVRKIGSGESRAFMYICGYMLALIVAIPMLGDHYRPLALGEWAMFISLGIISTIGLLCISYAFQEAPSASTVAPYHYTQILWGALLGFFVFGDVPHIETLIGAALLIGSGLYLLHHEHRKAALKPEEA